VSARARLWLAWTMLGLSVVGWPLSIFTFAKDEPVVVLSLSWFAIIWTSVDIILTALVSKRQEEE
jgi:hypothetical protein